MSGKDLNEISDVVGTWSMVEAWDIGDDPKQPDAKTYPWGNPSSGYWVYDPSGHFSLMISQSPALPIPAGPFPSKQAPEQSSWLSPASPWKVPYELLIETFSTAAPYAYFGTYSVDLNANGSGGTINHHVEADVMRAYTGTVQKRPFLFDGHDYLNVGEPGKYLRYKRFVLFRPRLADTELAKCPSSSI